MSSKSASRKLSGPGADSFIPSMNGGSSDSLSPRSPRPAMSFGLTTLLTFLVFCSVIAPCRAQTSKIFQWGFAGNALSQSLPACRSFGITVKPFTAGNDTHGTPPFYMVAMAIGATPTTSLIGTDESNLAWVVDQPIGTQMLLEVVDANGSSGGVPPGLFTVVPGTSTTNCIPAASTEPAFTLTANVSGTLNTCQPWGLSIVGGVPPYNLTLAALNSPIVTNVTLAPTDDHFTFINRADPNTQLVAAISDFNGRWATGTPIVSTAGSSDVSCTGLVGGGSTNVKVAAQEKAAAAAAVSRKKTAVVAGVVVTVIVVLLLAGVGVWLFLRRRKVQQTTKEITPRQFEGGSAPVQTFQETGGQILSINSFIAPGSPPRSPGPSVLSHSMSRSSPSVSRSMAPLEENPFEPPPPLRRGPESASSNGSTHSHGLQVRNPNRPAAFTSFPTASVRRSAKEIEAGLETANSANSEYYLGDAAGSSDLGRTQSAMVAGPSGARQVPSRSASMGTSEGVFQHQDAGIVQELPPPYADRGRP
ncbi:hypothetical protein C8F04DRAFT_1001622 [Mycena alexandri]|uniref:Uncharacterized protein n=1 Tax=Mycena alexandri TaxID=1745969 RepID=A0AAD6SVV3_9AGAR|nr:hypothetical protein C8F04DRAFT_1001622 [Mycena alexandri]